MTSPVERISGPSSVSTPANFAKGNTASLTAMCLGVDLADRPAPRACLPTAIARRDLGQRHAGDLGDERHRARGARVHLEDEDAAPVARDGELHVHQAAHAELARQRARLRLDRLDGLGGERVGRQAAGRVARVDAGLLDVLHHAADDDVACRRRPRRRRPRWRRAGTGRPGSARLRRRRATCRLSRREASIAVSTKFSRPDVVVDDLHGAAAEHVRRAHHHRVADARRRPRSASSRPWAVPQAGARRPSLRDQLAEALAILGAVDGVGAGAEQLARPRSAAAPRGAAASGRRTGR